MLTKNLSWRSRYLRKIFVMGGIITEKNPFAFYVMTLCVEKPTPEKHCMRYPNQIKQLWKSAFKKISFSFSFLNTHK